MSVGQIFHGFQFDKDFFLNQNVGKEFADNLFPIKNFYGFLLLGFQSCFRELNRERILINFFQKSRSEPGMNGKKMHR